jgi:UDP-N-acetylglucosamine 4,6-dehydratase/UDP-glucose 4-epimerase
LEILFENKKVLITGGTGSLGKSLTKRLLEKGVDSIRIFSRNESNQIRMESEFNDRRLRFLIGDIRDASRLERAMKDVDIVFHSAALKHVPLIEYNPFEAVKTNVIGSQNIIDSCIKENVKICVAIGTDKAVSPLNTYGATKLLMEKLFIDANNYVDREKTKFFALRYGNVLGSSSSVLPTFVKQIQNKQKITITDPKMTRFSMTMKEALDFIFESTDIAKGSEVFLPKLKAYSIMDLKQALVELLGDTEEEIIGIRPGEKLREILIGEDEIRYAWNIKNKYMISNPMLDKSAIEKLYSAEKLSHVENIDEYSSDTAEKISIKELKEIIVEAGLLGKN